MSLLQFLEEEETRVQWKIWKKENVGSEIGFTSMKITKFDNFV